MERQLLGIDAAPYQRGPLGALRRSDRHHEGVPVAITTSGLDQQWSGVGGDGNQGEFELGLGGQLQRRPQAGGRVERGAQSARETCSLRPAWSADIASTTYELAAIRLVLD